MSSLPNGSLEYIKYFKNPSVFILGVSVICYITVAGSKSKQGNRMFSINLVTSLRTWQGGGGAVPGSQVIPVVIQQ